MLAVDDPALPVELIIYIIQLARDDRATIRAWSLVNHTCFSVTRYILFERLEIGFLPGKRELEVRGARRRVAHMEKYLTHPYASPLFGDFKGLPPMLIQSGEVEVLRDEVTLLAHKASLAGVEVRHELYEDMVRSLR